MFIYLWQINAFSLEVQTATRKQHKLWLTNKDFKNHSVYTCINWITFGGVDLDLKRETTWLVPGWTTMAIFFLSFAPKFVLEYIPKLLIWFKAIIVKAQEGLSISTSRRAIKKGIGNGALDMDWDNGFSPKRSLLKSLSKCNLQGNCFSNGQSSKTSHFEMKQQGYSMGLHGSAFLLIYKHTSTYCLSC